MAREIGSCSSALRVVLTFIAGQPAGRPAMTCGYAPTKEATLQMTSASRLSPKVHLALQHLIRIFFRVESVVSVRLAKSMHVLPPGAYADSCALVHYDSGVNPGLHYYEAEGTAPHVHDIAGPAPSRIIQCLVSTRPQAGFDQDVTKFEELADAPTQDNDAREAPEAEPPQEDGRLPIIEEESEADFEAHIMDV
eukprot:3876702-Pyramimonas_sp.AAC.1